LGKEFHIPEDEMSFKDVLRSKLAAPGVPAAHGSADPGPAPPVTGPALQPQAPLPRGGSPAPSGSSPLSAAARAETPSVPAEAAASHDDEALRNALREKADLSTTAASPRHQVEAWLATMVKTGASDLILRAGGRPSLRIDGRISFLPGHVPGPGPLLTVLDGVMGKARMEMWRERGSADAAIHLDALGRFRINAYKQMGEPAVVIRRINENPPRLDGLGLPQKQLQDLALRKRGLVLVTGVAGSGKSTTLAAMIQYLNENVERHVITLEDPVELLFKEQHCVISQREVGTDTTDFREGLRHALRQSPDVILIGEVRDAETVVAALEATETGHLVMSTMHTVNAAQSMDRILGFFPGERHSQVRQRLADNLAGVLSQRLIPKKGGLGMGPAYELILSTPHVRELIEEGKTTEMARVVESGSEPGLISFNECLRRLVEEQQVELGDALAASDRPEELLLALRGIRGSSDRVQAPKNAPSTATRSAPTPSTGDGLRLRQGRVKE
jgi:pilus retraction protein PilT